MTNEQLELGLAAATQNQIKHGRDKRSSRAAWWFGQMRQIVSQAIDWQAAPKPRPEQSWLGLSHPGQSA